MCCNAGLWRAGRVSARHCPSGARSGTHHPERRRPRGRARPALKEAPRVLGRPRRKRGRATREFLVLCCHQAAPCRLQSKSRDTRSRSMDGRVRLPEPAWRRPHPDRPVLRLPHQRRQLSRLGRLAAAAPTGRVGYLGQVRSLLSRCRDSSLSTGSAWGGGPHPRCRPLCAVREAGRDCRADWRFSRTHARSASRAQAITVTVSRAQCRLPSERCRTGAYPLSRPFLLFIERPNRIGKSALVHGING